MKKFSLEFINQINHSKNKFRNLYRIVKFLNSVAVAYSGGIDSTLCAKVCFDVLGDNAVCITADSPSLPHKELNNSIKIAKQIGIRHIIIKTNELNNNLYSENSPLRCYYCKSELYAKMKKIVRELNLKNIVNGENLSDVSDYRPGSIAGKENSVRSPLREAGLTKDDCRYLAKMLELPNWDLPASACLSSRIAYGQMITKENLSMVEKAEDFLKSIGFKHVRVRYHNKIAQIEVPEKDFKKIIAHDLKNKIVAELRAIGFIFVTLNLEGLKSGSMNRLIAELQQDKKIDT